MSHNLIDVMVNRVNEGHDARNVIETSLTYSPGSELKANKATTGVDPVSGASISIPEGTVVTIIAVGGGDSGVDHHVQLPDGNQAIVPFNDLGT